MAKRFEKLVLQKPLNKKMFNDLQGLVVKITSHFYSKENSCFYFVLDEELYGFTKMENKEILDFPMYIVWKEFALWDVYDDTDGGESLDIGECEGYEFLDDRAVQELVFKMQRGLKDEEDWY